MTDLFTRLTHVPTTTSHEGGAVYAVDDRVALRRFLVIGAFDTFYVSGAQNAEKWKARVDGIVRRDARMALEEVVDVALGRLAQRRDPSLFVLARLMMPDVPLDIRREAADSLSYVAATGTDLLHFMAYRYGANRTSNRLFRNAVRAWFQRRTVGDLALQAVKYDSRDGWTMRDVLRLVRLADDPQQPVRALVYRWMANPEARLTLPHAPIADVSTEETGAEDVARLLIGYSELRMPHTSSESAARLIKQYRLPREAVPSDLLTSPLVWLALKDGMPAQALLRNLGKLGSLGLLGKEDVPRIVATGKVVHPFAVLIAKAVYDSGRSVKGDLQWSPVASVSDALDDAFELAFGTLSVDYAARPLIALDVSGSMAGRVDGSVLTPLLAEAGLAMILAKQYPNAHFVSFSGGREATGSLFSYSPFMRLSGISPIAIHNMTYRGVLDKISRAGELFGPTDVNLPFEMAARDESYTSVIVITDNETRNTRLVPEVLARIHARQPEFRAAVIAMAANRISVLDPRDRRQADFVGADASLPRLLTQFLGGDLG